MKRFHIHVSVKELAPSIRFYSTLVGAAPPRVEADYAKWMLEDPRVNFAISTHRQPAGVNHLGFQVDSGEELRGCARNCRPPMPAWCRRMSKPAAMPARTSTG